MHQPHPAASYFWSLGFAMSAAQIEEIVYPEALCVGNWSVLFENGEVFPVKYFLDKHGEQLPSHKGAHGIMFDAPNGKCFFVEINEIDILSLH